MNSKNILAIGMIAAVLACSKPDESPETGKFALKVPNGIAFSEFKDMRAGTHQFVAIQALRHKDVPCSASRYNPQLHQASGRTP